MTAIFRYLLSFIAPQVIFEIPSPISGEIKVVQHLGKRSLIVGDLTQSVSPRAAKGRVWGRLVDFALNVAAKEGQSIRSVLLLGLGGGTMLHLLQKRLGEVGITAVEIDPVVVRVAEDYFGVGGLKNLRLIVADAIQVVEKPEKFSLRPSFYDLIIVDLYLGNQLPPGTEAREFLQGLRGLLLEKSLIAFNRVSESPTLDKELRRSFSRVETEVITAYGGGKNYLYLAW